MPTSVATILTVFMFGGLVFSVLLLTDAIRDRMAIHRANLRARDPRRPLNTGLLVFAISYTLLKIVLAYTMINTLADFELSPTAIIALRITLTAALVCCDIGVGIFWLLRRKALSL